MTSPDYSTEFYRQYAQEYARVADQFLQSVYLKSSHTSLKDDWNLLDRLIQLAPGPRGLDAGCGAGGRDVFHAWSLGYDVIGIDSIEENIQATCDLHSEIAGRVFLADLRHPLPFDNDSFDFLACNAVIQHIEPDVVKDVVLPEFVRVLRPGGVLQLMFKCGNDIATVFDRDYGVDRSFRLYQESDLIGILNGFGMTLIADEDPEKLAGLMYFTDPKNVDHCVFFARKFDVNQDVTLN